MCGIIGYIGPSKVTDLLVDGLRKLEYRGYDSAGLATLNGAGVRVVKVQGRVDRLAASLATHDLQGEVGIAHTRWATHGVPSDGNAHPHTDCFGKIAVVHNGIIENFDSLKKRLMANGHRFKSDTDTEVLAHLVEEEFAGDLVQAVQRALPEIVGSYAICVLSEHDPDHLVVARKDSPLVIGLGQGENYVASDIPAIVEKTRSIFVLENGEMAVVGRSSVDVLGFDGQRIDKQLFKVEWEPEVAGKADFDDFMLKEIHEQPQALQATLQKRVWSAQDDTVQLSLAETKLSADAVRSMDHVAIVACGTAYHAGLVGKAIIEALTDLRVETDLASEFRYRSPKIDGGTLAVFISQSGETADTLAALRSAKEKGAVTLAVVNVKGSSIAREADHVLYTMAGPEIAVASTKAYLTQLASLAMLGAFLGRHRNTVEPERIDSLLRALLAVPAQVEALLVASEDHLRRLGQRWKPKRDAFFIGRGVDFYAAMEGQLKLKEISYLHAEALPAGELKHGTLALITTGVPVVAIATQQALQEKMVSNIQEVRARGGEILGICTAGNQSIKDVVDQVIYLPATDPLLTPVLSVVPLQLLAYYAAKARGCDVDKPRNLAKSVTVE